MIKTQTSIKGLIDRRIFEDHLDGILAIEDPNKKWTELLSVNLDLFNIRVQERHEIAKELFPKEYKKDGFEYGLTPEQKLEVNQELCKRAKPYMEAQNLLFKKYPFTF